jgi:hypothetical protein
MRNNPLVAALNAVQQATEAVHRAQVFFDYLGKTEANDILSAMHASLVIHQRALQALVIKSEE